MLALAFSDSYHPAFEAIISVGRAKACHQRLKIATHQWTLYSLARRTSCD